MRARNRVSGTWRAVGLALGIALGTAPEPAIAGMELAAAASAKAEPPAPRASEDLVIRRDGSTARGRINSCIDDVCYLDGRSESRAAIAWIGFRTAEAAPPGLEDPTQDEARLDDASVRHGRLVGVSQGEVLLQTGSLDRAAVAWIHLAAPAGAPPAPGEIRHPEIKGGDDGGGGSGGSGGSGGAGGSGGGGATGGGTAGAGADQGAGGDKSSGGGSASRGAGTGTNGASGDRLPKRSSPLRPCPADLPLGGELVQTWSWYFHSPPVLEGRIDEEIQLHFTLLPYNNPATSPWPAELWNEYKASEIRYRVTSSGLRPVPGLETCEAPGADVHGTLAMGRMGKSGFESLPGPNGYLTVNLTSPELDLLQPDALQNASEQPVECHSSGGGVGRSSVQYGSPGLALRGAACEGAEPQVMCVRQTVCRHPDSLDCMRHPDLYAVLPWEGEADGYPTGPMDPTISMHARWKICCGCGAGPFAPPGLGPSTDRCGSTADADGFAERNRDERSQKLAAAREHAKAWQEHLKEARAHYDDFATTVKACLVQGAVKMALIAFLAPEANVEAWEWIEEFGALSPTGYQLLAKIADKLVEGEDPTTALSPEEVQIFLETAAALEKVESAFDGADVAQMEASMEHCAGAFLVSAETKLSADKCVEEFKAALEEQTQMDEQLNGVRQLDTDYPDLQYKAWKACVERARCLGEPESPCDSKKPAGNWPAVP